ncbi:hypothetical protein EJB05_26498, partial [Eragrostis curvula]
MGHSVCTVHVCSAGHLGPSSADKYGADLLGGAGRGLVARSSVGTGGGWGSCNPDYVQRREDNRQS